MKTEVLGVRLTEQDKIILVDNARKYNMTISDYVRYCCIIRPPKLLIREKRENQKPF